MDKKTIIIIVMGVIILAGLFCFLVPKYNLWQQNKGIQLGHSQMLVTIMQQAFTCEEIPLTFNNQTIKIKKTEC